MTRRGPRAAHETLPRTTLTRHPKRAMLHGLRPAFQAYANRRFAIELRGTSNFPVTGPVVVAANHIGFVDGPLLAIMSPRPVHALTKREMFAGKMGGFLTGAGQIPIWRDEPDPEAVRTAICVLREGGVIGVFPEGTRGDGEMTRMAGGAAYFALAAGATVVPLAILGTRLPGSTSSFPPAGTRLVMTYGEPLTFPRTSWPRRKAEVASASQEIRNAILQTVREAEAATGMSLPGPLPPTQEMESL